MSKKSRKNRKARSVLHSLKDLGQDSRDTLSRLATTVKSDMPTLVLGNGATVKNEGYSPFNAVQAGGAKPLSRLSRIAQKLVPFRKSPEWQTSHKMKHIAKQMAKGNSSMKVRRSRLPIVAAAFALMLAAGGFYTYQNVSLPDVNVSQYLDYKAWLGLASGQVKPNVATQTTRDSRSASSGYSSSGYSSNYTSSYHVSATKTAKMPATKAQGSTRHTAAKSTAKAEKVAKASKASKTGGKSFSKLSRTEKEKVWKAKLAKLKQQSGKKHQTVSHKTSKGAHARR